MKIILTEKAYFKIKSMCEISKENEWIGLLVIDNVENNLQVSDLIIPYQTVGGASAKINDDRLTKDIEQLMHTNPEVLPRIKGVIHSHNDMGTFFSVIDDNMNDGLNRYLSENNLFLSVVVNNQMKFISKLILKANGFNVTLDNLEIETKLENETIKKEVQKIFDEKVKEISYGYTTYDRPYPMFTILSKNVLEFIAECYDKNKSIKNAVNESKKLRLNENELKDFKRIAKSYFNNTSFSKPLLLELEKISVKEWTEELKEKHTKKVQYDKWMDEDEEYYHRWE